MSFNGWNQGQPVRTFRDDYHESRYQSLVRSGTRPGLAQSMVAQMEGARLVSSAGSSGQPEFGRGLSCSSGSCGPPAHIPSRDLGYRGEGRPVGGCRPSIHSRPSTSSRDRPFTPSRAPVCGTGGCFGGPTPAPSRHVPENPFTEDFLREQYNTYRAGGVGHNRTIESLREGFPHRFRMQEEETARGRQPTGGYSGGGESQGDQYQQPREERKERAASRPPTSSRNLPFVNPFRDPFLRQTYTRYIEIGLPPDRVVQVIRENYPNHFRVLEGERAPPRAGGQILGGPTRGGGQGGQYQPPPRYESRNRGYAQPPRREESRDRGYAQPPPRQDRDTYQAPREDRGRSSPRPAAAPTSQDFSEAEHSMFERFSRLGLQPENAAREVLRQRGVDVPGSAPRLEEQSRDFPHRGGPQYGGSELSCASSQRRPEDVGFGLRGNPRFNPDEDETELPEIPIDDGY